MSRGPGSLQREILDALQDGPQAEPSLLWRIATQRGSFDGDKISRRLHASHHRAVSRLLERDLISAKPRKLGTLSEVTVVYPDATLSKQTRALRQIILPLVPTFLQSARAMRYNLAAREAYVYERLKEHVKVDVERRWVECVPALRNAIAASPHFWLYLNLLARGEALFGTGTRTPKSEHAFCALFEKTGSLGEVSHEERELAGQLTELKERAFPAANLERVRWRVQLYNVFASGQGSRERLTDDFARFLADQKLPKLSALLQRKRALFGHGSSQDVRIDDSLHKVFRRDLYNDFRFLRLR